MTLVVIGAVLVFAGIALAGMRTAGWGRLSQSSDPTQTPPRAGGLEPTGKGRRLSFKPDLPGLGIVAVGAILILVGALS